MMGVALSQLCSPSLLLCAGRCASSAAPTDQLDRIVAIAEEDVIRRNELDRP
jgi:hypothetical protein